MMTANYEKKDFKRLFLYVDILVVGLFTMSLMLLVRDAYIAGYWEERNAALHYEHFWNIVRDSVMLVASLAWIFMRYFRDKIAAMQNPWA